MSDYQSCSIYCISKRKEGVPWNRAKSSLVIWHFDHRACTSIHALYDEEMSSDNTQVRSSQRYLSTFYYFDWHRLILDRHYKMNPLPATIEDQHLDILTTYQKNSSPESWQYSVKRVRIRYHPIQMISISPSAHKVDEWRDTSEIHLSCRSIGIPSHSVKAIIITGSRMLVWTPPWRINTH
jgi:hypothetical protein